MLIRFLRLLLIFFLRCDKKISRESFPLFHFVPVLLDEFIEVFFGF